MKEFLKSWLFKDDVERMEWYLERRKGELDRNYQDRCNYLEMKYAMIERENKVLHERLSEILNFMPTTPLIFSVPTGGETK
jgi:hypothetical protein